MKLLFVDIDGPLATDGCSDVKFKTKWHNNLYKMNPSCVKILNEILEEHYSNDAVKVQNDEFVSVKDINAKFDQIITMLKK